MKSQVVTGILFDKSPFLNLELSSVERAPSLAGPPPPSNPPVSPEGFVLDQASLKRRTTLCLEAINSGCEKGGEDGENNF